MEDIYAERAGWTNDLELFRQNLSFFDVGLLPRQENGLVGGTV